MKPFFEAGLKEFANHVGYPSITCVLKSLEDELEGITEDFVSSMLSMDDTWAFCMVWLCLQGLHATYFVIP